MWAAWGKRKLRPVVGRDDRYQILSPPATVVRESSLPNTPRSRDPISSPSEGLTATREPITLKGDLQEFVRRSIARFFGFPGPPEARDWWLVAYVASVALLSSAAVTALLFKSPSDVPAAVVAGVAALAAAALLAELQSVPLSSQRCFMGPLRLSASAQPASCLPCGPPTRAG